MSSSDPPWVRDALALPVAFAQVREDPLIDLWVVRRIGAGARGILVASGGCTAALLASARELDALHLVDPQPAQLALARLKLRLLATHGVSERRALLGHAPMDASARRERLGAEWRALDLPADVLGPEELVARDGPDHAGRYERVFAALRDALRGETDDLAALLRMRDPAEQARRVAPTTPLGRCIDEAFEEVMALPNLVRLFGEEATRNPVEPFSRHFARRLRHVLGTLPADRNPYLWQMLAGRFPDGVVSPWLAEPEPARAPVITWSCEGMADALTAAPSSFDFVHLSNILDWLSPESARATLDRAWGALRPGGWTIVRQLDSVLDVPSLGPAFDWHTAEANDLHARDRSFFYRGLHLGRKR